ncbi:unnamed protein product, partial [marine sediment metagenome]
TERARRNKEDVKAQFRSGGSITVRLTKLEDNTIEGSSENFGKVTMPVEAFRVIEFNVYREKKDEDEDGFMF